MLCLTLYGSAPDLYLFDGLPSPGTCCGWVAVAAGGRCRVGLDLPDSVEVLRGEVLRRDCPALWAALGGRPPARFASFLRSFVAASAATQPDAFAWRTTHGLVTAYVLRSNRPVLLDLRASPRAFILAH